MPKYEFISKYSTVPEAIRNTRNKKEIQNYVKKQEPTHLSIYSSILYFIYPMYYKANSVYQIVFVP